MWYKKVVSVILFFFILFVVIVFPGQAKTPTPTPEKHGNTEGNILNGGFAVESEGIIYYSNDSGIWKVKNDNTGKTLISKDKASYLNAMDGWLYYKNAKEKGIFKIKIDGNEKTKICSDSITSMNIIGNNIYYSSSNEGKGNIKTSVYKIRTNGSGKTIILPSYRSNNSYFNAEEDKLYYLIDENLIKINLDGTQKLFVAPESVEKFFVSGDWIYYYALRTFQKDALFRVNVDGSKKSTIVENAGCFNVNGNYVYYEKLSKFTKAEIIKDGFSVDFDSEKLLSINRRNLDGTDDTKIIDVEATSINVVGDWIFYKAVPQREKKEKLFKIKADGSENQLVE